MSEINERFLEEAKEQKRRAERFPELADALKECVVALDHLQNVLMVRVNPQTLENARAAYFKATGEEA